MSHPEQERLAGQIESIVSAAERAAEEFQRKTAAEAEQEAENIRQAAEAEARRIRQEAATWAAAYLEDSKLVVDEFTAERIARIGSLTDELVQGAEAVQRRLSDAQTVRRQVYDLISSLGALAEAIALEARVAPPELAGPPLDADAGEARPGEASEPAEGIEPGA
jgi:cell division septum initiation protein DivIVA